MHCIVVPFFKNFSRSSECVFIFVFRSISPCCIKGSDCFFLNVLVYDDLEYTSLRAVSVWDKEDVFDLYLELQIFAFANHWLLRC